jgi:hypothetical protein
MTRLHYREKGAGVQVDLDRLITSRMLIQSNSGTVAQRSGVSSATCGVSSVTQPGMISPGESTGASRSSAPHPPVSGQRVQDIKHILNRYIPSLIQRPEELREVASAFDDLDKLTLWLPKNVAP